MDNTQEKTHPLFGVPAGVELLNAIGRLSRTHPDIASRALQAIFSDGVGGMDGERVGARLRVVEGDGQPVKARPVIVRVGDRVARKVYSAQGKGPIPAHLTPAQANVLNVLRSTQDRYTVDDLAAACGLKRKSVENILSVLRGGKLIDTHEPE